MTNRAHRLRACGNAVVPACASEALLLLAARAVESERHALETSAKSR